MCCMSFCMYCRVDNQNNLCTGVARAAMTSQHGIITLIRYSVHKMKTTEQEEALSRYTVRVPPLDI